MDLPLQLLDGAQSLYKERVAPHVSPTAVAVLVAVLAISLAYLRSRPQSSSQTAGTEKSSGASSTATNNNNVKPKDIFATFHRGKDKQGGANKKAHAAEKPFGSSYY
jgi:hypothetical protein